MKINFKFIVIVLGIAVAAGLLYVWYVNYETRSHSPKDEVVHASAGLNMSVEYSRPYKKGRLIFGGLVPFDTPWRTGANEATVFKTNQAIEINGQLLPAGNYSLWTIPGKDSWKVMFNKEPYVWGIENGDANFNVADNILEIEVSAYTIAKSIEQFTIIFEENNGELALVLMWDTTMVVVPLAAP